MRVARKDLDTSFLHVMVQGINKEFIFKNKDYINYYWNIINNNKERFNVTIMAYCIMNNHAHFLIYMEDFVQFAKFMHIVNYLYSKMYNKNENRCGVVFRNRYLSEPIYNEKYLVNCINYIHNNPVKAKIVSKCEEYEFSSYKDFMNNTGVTQTEIMKELFGVKCDYSELFRESFEKRFIDIDEPNKGSNKYIINGVRDFLQEKQKCLADIFSERETMKELIAFLREEWKIQYLEIQSFFDISRGVFDSLRGIK